MTLLDWLLGRGNASRSIAKERLQSIVAHDRAGIPPRLMQIVKREMIRAVSEHLIIDPGATEVAVDAGHGQSLITAYIPILGVRRRKLGPQVLKELEDEPL